MQKEVSEQMVGLFYLSVSRHSGCKVRYFSPLLKKPSFKNIVGILSLQQQLLVLQQCFSKTSLAPDTPPSLSPSGSCQTTPCVVAPPSLSWRDSWIIGIRNDLLEIYHQKTQITNGSFSDSLLRSLFFFHLDPSIAFKRMYLETRAHLPKAGFSNLWSSASSLEMRTAILAA